MNLSMADLRNYRTEFHETWWSYRYMFLVDPKVFRFVVLKLCVHIKKYHLSLNAGSLCKLNITYYTRWEIDLVTSSQWKVKLRSRIKWMCKLQNQCVDQICLTHKINACLLKNRLNNPKTDLFLHN
jgi:hypothetical protein